MPGSGSQTGNNTTWMAALLAVLIGLTLPLSYLSFGYQHQTAALKIEVKAYADLVSQFIRGNTQPWHLNDPRLRNLLDSHIDQGYPDSRRIFDKQGNFVIELGDALSWPFIVGSAPLLDSGSVAGRIEIRHSLQPLFIGTGLAALLGLMLGLATFFTMKAFALKTLKRALRPESPEKEHAQITLNAIGDAVITTGIAGRIEYLNPAAERLTDWSNAEARGMPLSKIFNVIYDVHGEAPEYPIGNILTGGAASSLPSCTTLVQRNGHKIPIENCAAPIRDGAGIIIGAVLVFRDVSKAHEITQKLTHQAIHDSLTGLINRSEFERRLEYALASAYANNTEHVLCYMDLDQFKAVNDTCGHTAGDELLRQFSTLLKSEVRETDTLARLGGDEFCVLLHNCSLEKAQGIIDHILHAIKEFRFTWQDNRQNKVFSIGMSVGLAHITSTSTSISDVINIADINCYTAKNQGGNRIQMNGIINGQAEPDWQRKNIDWRGKINHALAENRFILYQQKIMPLCTNSTSGEYYEVLLRLRDTGQQLIMPGAFMPAAERYNLMPTIDRWVIKTAFHTIQEVYTGNKGRKLCSCSINLSAASIMDPHILAYICEQTSIYGVSPDNICFEITESAALSDVTRVTDLVWNLKSLGFHFTLEHFGSEFCSFSYLKNIPVDYLKIDGTLIKNVFSDPADSAVVDAINQLGHIMGIQTIAGHTESDSALGKLRDLGIDYAQGFGLAAPKPLMEWGGMCMQI